MKTRFNSCSMKTQILLITLLQILVPIIIIGVVSVIISTSVIKSQMWKNTEDFVESIKSRTETYTENIFMVSQEIVYDHDIFGLLTDDRTEPKRDNDQDHLQNIIQRILLSRNEVDAISLVLDGTEVKASKRKSMIAAKNSVAYNQILSLAEKCEGKPLWYFDAQGGQVKNIFMARVLYNPYDNTKRGMAIFQINREGFRNAGGMDPGNYTFSLFTENGDMIYTNNDHIEEEVFSKETGRSRVNNNIVISKKIESLGWYAVCRINLKWLYKDVYFLVEWMTLLCIVSIMLLIGFSWFVQRRYVNPIKQLVGVIKHWSGDCRIETAYEHRHDEIGALYSGFADMTDRIVNLINCNYRNQIIKKEMELKMLQSQINPHFLFNTLETISCVAELNNVQEISRMVVALSDILNKSMGKGDKLISLRQELFHTDNYIYIMKMRFGDKISVIKDIAADTLELIVPALMIQPIVENAIYHGIMPMDESGMIRISSRIEEGALLITVEDNGAGITPAKVRALNERFAIDNDTHFEQNGLEHIGLENVNRRIKLFYGENSGLSIESNPFVKTVVTMRIDSAERMENNV